MTTTEQRGKALGYVSEIRDLVKMIEDGRSLDLGRTFDAIATVAAVASAAVDGASDKQRMTRRRRVRKVLGYTVP